MKLKLILSLPAVAAVLIFAGCESAQPPLPRITYPATYQIQVGNTQVASSYGPQNTNVTATQDIAVEPGRQLYYQVVSPVIVTMYVYEKPSASDPTSRRLIGQMQGTTFLSSVDPSTSTMEFAFTASQPNSSGTVQFTLSDRPLTAPPAMAVSQ